jgi:thioesterase domain-containing protein/acyl carrier protein
MESINIIGKSPEEKRALLIQLLSEKAASGNNFFPISYQQQGLWLFQQIFPKSSVYNLSRAYKLSSQVKPEVIEKACKCLVKGHPALKTVFSIRDGRPVQQILLKMPLPYEVIDSSPWKENKLYQKLYEHKYKPFDLERGPLFRVQLFISGQDFNIILFTVHHIVADFRSLELLTEDLQTLILNSGFDDYPVTSRLPYLDFVEWQSNMLSGPEGERLWYYWQNKLTGDLPQTVLPADRSRTPVRSFAGKSMNFVLSEKLNRRLIDFITRQNLSLYHVLLSAFTVFLNRYTGKTDILLGTPVSGRHSSRWERTVGCFANTLVLRININMAANFREILNYIGEIISESLNHQDFPFRLLVERICCHRNLSYYPLFQIAFECISKSGEPVEETLMEPLPLESGPTPYDLNLVIKEEKDKIIVGWQYDSDLFDEATIIRMNGQFTELLEKIIDNPQEKPEKLPLLNDFKHEPATVYGRHEPHHIAPRNYLEQVIADIWSEILGSEKVCVTDNLFELGANSLSVVQAVARVREVAGIHLELHDVFKEPTIAGIAANAPKYSSACITHPCLVSIQPMGSKHPFFCIHPISGHVLLYYNLARHMGVDRPFFGLQSPRLSGSQTVLNTVEEMADYYMDIIRLVQPRGPYLLGGWSFGGMVAFEMANRLHSRGLPVDFLALIDTPNLQFLGCDSEPPSDIDLLAQAVWEIGWRTGNAFKDFRNELQGMERWQQLNYTVRRLKEANLVPLEFGVKELRTSLETIKTNDKAARIYCPGQYPGNVNIYRAIEKRDGEFDTALDKGRHFLGWHENCTGQVKVHMVPGRHATVVSEPNSRILGELLKLCIEEV